MLIGAVNPPSSTLCDFDNFYTGGSFNITNTGDVVVAAANSRVGEEVTLVSTGGSCDCSLTSCSMGGVTLNSADRVDGVLAGSAVNGNISVTFVNGSFFGITGNSITGRILFDFPEAASVGSQGFVNTNTINIARIAGSIFEFTTPNSGVTMNTGMFITNNVIYADNAGQKWVDTTGVDTLSFNSFGNIIRGATSAAGGVGTINLFAVGIIEE